MMELYSDTEQFLGITISILIIFGFFYYLHLLYSRVDRQERFKLLNITVFVMIGYHMVFIIYLMSFNELMYEKHNWINRGFAIVMMIVFMIGMISRQWIGVRKMFYIPTVELLFVLGIYVNEVTITVIIGIMVLIILFWNESKLKHLVLNQGILSQLEEQIFVFNSAGKKIYQNKVSRFNMFNIIDVLNQYSNYIQLDKAECDRIKSEVLNGRDIDRTFEVFDGNETYSCHFFMYSRKGKDIKGYILSMSNISELKELIEENNQREATLLSAKQLLLKSENTEQELIQDKIRISLMNQLRERTLRDTEYIIKTLKKENLDDKEWKLLMDYIRRTLNKIRKFVREIG